MAVAARFAFRQIVDRLHRRGTNHGNGGGEICPAAAVGDHVGAESLYLPARAVDRHRVAHPKLMPLKAGLELLKAVVRKPYRLTVSVSSGDEGIVRHVVMVLGAVAHGIERVQEQPL